MEPKFKETRLQSYYGKSMRFYSVLFQAGTRVYVISANRIAATPDGEFHHGPKVVFEETPKRQELSAKLVKDLTERAYKAHDFW